MGSQGEEPWVLNLIGDSIVRALVQIYRIGHMRGPLRSYLRSQCSRRPSYIGSSCRVRVICSC